MADSTFAFLLADVGEGLHEAEVRRWLVQPGDRVTLDQPLVEIETDKAVVELPSPIAGTVERLGADEGSIIHVGDLVALHAGVARIGAAVSLRARERSITVAYAIGLATVSTALLFAH